MDGSIVAILASFGVFAYFTETPAPPATEQVTEQTVSSEVPNEPKVTAEQ